jgi:hypothetical protein
MTPSSDISDLVGRLIARYESMPETPQPGESHEDVVRRFELTSWLISWCYDHPATTVADYRREKARALRDGPRWPEVREIVADSDAPDDTRHLHRPAAAPESPNAVAPHHDESCWAHTDEPGIEECQK